MEVVREILSFAEHQALFLSERYDALSIALPSGAKITAKKWPPGTMLPQTTTANYRQHAAIGDLKTIVFEILLLFCRNIEPMI